MRRVIANRQKAETSLPRHNRLATGDARGAGVEPVGAGDTVRWDVPFISIISEIGVACALRARREQWRPFA